MEESREFKRYKVSSLSVLSGKIDRLPVKADLVTLGLGGCGFFAVPGTLVLSPPRRLHLNFETTDGEGLKIDVQGNLIYARSIPMNEKEILFYGIEFLAPHRERIQPVINLLEELHQKGEVPIA